jgi:plasmid maintenance system antidote protein VapI
MADAESAAKLARELHLTRNSLNTAKARGRLSPTVAGQLAERLGEDPGEWIAIAALEAEPPSAARSRLARALEKARKS